MLLRGVATSESTGSVTRTGVKTEVLKQREGEVGEVGEEGEEGDSGLRRSGTRQGLTGEYSLDTNTK